MSLHIVTTDQQERSDADVDEGRLSGHDLAAAIVDARREPSRYEPRHAMTRWDEVTGLWDRIVAWWYRTSPWYVVPVADRMHPTIPVRQPVHPATTGAPSTVDDAAEVAE
jgi:hypothetical protein